MISDPKHIYGECMYVQEWPKLATYFNSIFYKNNS